MRFRTARNGQTGRIPAELRPLVRDLQAIADPTDVARSAEIRGERP